jgi:actin-related protein 4
MSIHNPIGKDGIVEDWDMAEKVWEYSFTSRLTGTKPGNPFLNGLNDIPAEELPTEMEVELEEKSLADSPLLMTEPAWNPAKAREKTIEIAMEKWGTPAFYLARNGVLASYVSSRYFFTAASSDHHRTKLTRLSYTASRPEKPLP